MTSFSQSDDEPVDPRRLPLTPITGRSRRLLLTQLDKSDSEVVVMRPHMMRSIPTIIEPEEDTDATARPGDPPV
jgi:hypothetical protein